MMPERERERERGEIPKRDRIVRKIDRYGTSSENTKL